MKLQTLAVLVGSLCALAEASKIHSDLSYYNTEFNSNEEADAIALSKGCKANKCYDYYYNEVYYKNYKSDGVSGFIWLLFLLILCPIYCCLRCGGCIKD